MAEERAQGDAHAVDEVLPVGRMAAFGLQHVLSMYAGIIAVPLILATAIRLPQEELVYVINASFFMCGVATLIQTLGFWRFGVRLPIVQGTTREGRPVSATAEATAHVTGANEVRREERRR